MSDMNLHEWLTMIPLVGLIVFLGVYPKPMLERIEPSVNRLLEHIETQVPSFTAPFNREPADGEPEAGE